MTEDRRPSPFPLRLSDAQRAEARSRAAREGISLAALFKTVLDSPSSSRSRLSSGDRAELACLMAHVGKIGSNINQLAHQANAGSWPDHFAIEQAVAEVRWMRDAVMKTLGITPPPVSTTPASPSLP